MERPGKYRSVKDAINFLKEDIAMKEIVSEYTKMIKLTISIISCTAGRSFSAFRRCLNILINFF